GEVGEGGVSRGAGPGGGGVKGERRMEFRPGETAPDAVSPAPVADEPTMAAEPAVVDEPAVVEEPASAEAPAGTRGAVAPRPSTGDARVDDAVARLDGLAGLPVAEHLARFEYVHERLTEALGDLDVHAPVRSGDASPGPRG